MTVHDTSRGDTVLINLRLLLIFCVFIGNALEPLLADMPIAQEVYTWIFMFHIPLFVFVTGYFSKFNLLGSGGRKVLLQIGLQYLIFQTLYSSLDALFFHVPGIDHSFFAPYLLLWFLASHICWRLLMMLLIRLSVTSQLAVAFGLGIMIGYLPVDGIWLSLSRTFVFMPFFVIGYHFSYEKLAAWWNRKARVTAIVLSCMLLSVSGLIAQVLPAGWLYGSMTYLQLGHTDWYAGLFRIGIYLLQIAASVVFLGFVPLAAGFWTDMGRRTLYVFLLHGFVIRAAVISGIYSYITLPYEALLLIVTACGATALLTLPTVRTLSHAIVEPRTDWLLRYMKPSLRQPRKV